MKKSSSTSGLVRLQCVTDIKASNARDLRKKMTVAEEILWKQLRNRKVAGLKFRRQQIIEGFITDFYCEDGMFCIEIDGGIHKTSEQQKKDKYRSRVFANRGIRTLRISNDEVFIDMPKAIRKIIKFWTSPRPSATPLP